MKILLLGGAGFIGSATASALLEAGHEVRIADSFDPQIHGDDFRRLPAFRQLSAQCEVQVADVRDRAATERALLGIDAVYFLAAGTGTGQSMYQVHRYCDVNVLGAAVFAELLPHFRDRIRKVVVSSTRAIYGEGAARCREHGRVFPTARSADQLRRGNWNAQCPQCGTPVEPLASAETDAWSPTSVYGLTKLAQEQLLVQTCRHSAIPAVIFRYQNVYGPGQALRNPYTGILAIFTQLLARGEEVNVFEDGQPTRDFVHIADVVSCNLRALESENAEPLICNVGAGVRTTLIAVVQALATALGGEPRHRITGDFRAGDIRHACADLTQLALTFGPRSFIGFEKGVRSLVDWVRTQDHAGLAKNAYQDSLVEMRRTGLLGRKSTPGL